MKIVMMLGWMIMIRAAFAWHDDVAPYLFGIGILLAALGYYKTKAVN